MASYNLTEIYTATEGQQLFPVLKPYVPNTQQILVHVNGLLVFNGIDYTEQEMSINLTELCNEGDVVSITFIDVNNDIDMDIVGDRSSVFRRYGQSSRLKNNNRYHVNIAIKKKNFKWTFSSRYTPLYSNSNKIKGDTGDLLNSLTDEQVNYLLYINSKEVDEILREYEERGDALSGDVSDKTFAYNKSQWVRYKTCIDIVNAIYLTIAGQSGSVIKKIGPINVEKTTKIPYLSDMLARFKELFKPYDDMLRNGGNTSVSVVGFTRAGTSYAYPLSTRRSF